MTTNFKCDLCSSENGSEEVTIQRCNHVICWKCLSDHILPRLAPKIKCPVRGCQKYLSDDAIRKVLSDEDTERYERLMLDKIPQMIKCLLPECPYVFIWDSTDGQFDCSECSLFNCLRCRAAHKYISCEQYGSSDESQRYCRDEVNRAKNVLKARNSKIYRELFKEMEATDLFIYDTLLECPNCCRHLAKGDGIILRCTHVFCRYCLNSHITNTFSVPIACPSAGCKKPIEEREIQQLLSEQELTTYIGSCNSVVRAKIDFTLQCQTPNCIFLVEYSIKPDIIKCPLCHQDNCTKCVTIHTNETCTQFRERIKDTPQGRSLLDIETKIRNKEIMRCLKCQQLLEKIRGCSWIQCSNCQFEMCWALQIRRWGPKGRGDVSDGCKCLVNGKYCAKNCGTCIPHRTSNDVVGNDDNLDNILRLFRQLQQLRQLEQDVLIPPRPYIAPTSPNPPKTNNRSCSIS